MNDAVEKGLLQGLLTAGIAFIVLEALNYSHTSVMILLYMFVAFGAFFEFKNSLNYGLTDLFGEVVIVAEEEEKTLKRVFKNKKYRIKGELEEI